MTMPSTVQLSNGPSKYPDDVIYNDLHRASDDVVCSPIYEVIAFPVSNQLSYALAGLHRYLLPRNRRKMDIMKRKMAMMRAEKARAIREEMECGKTSSIARRGMRTVMSGIAKAIRGHFSRMQQYSRLREE